MKTLKKFMSCMLITSLGVYGLWFTERDCIDIFTIYAIFCFGLNWLVLLTSGNKEVMDSLMENYQVSVVRAIIGKLYVLSWFIIWGQVVLDGHFWTGFIGMGANLAAIILGGTVSKENKKREKESDTNDQTN